MSRKQPNVIKQRAASDCEPCGAEDRRLRLVLQPWRGEDLRLAVLPCLKAAAHAAPARALRREMPRCEAESGLQGRASCEPEFKATFPLSRMRYSLKAPSCRWHLRFTCSREDSCLGKKRGFAFWPLVTEKNATAFSRRTSQSSPGQ